MSPTSYRTAPSRENLMARCSPSCNADIHRMSFRVHFGPLAVTNSTRAPRSGRPFAHRSPRRAMPSMRAVQSLIPGVAHARSVRRSNSFWSVLTRWPCMVSRERPVTSTSSCGPCPTRWSRLAGLGRLRCSHCCAQHRAPASHRPARRDPRSAFRRALRYARWLRHAPTRRPGLPARCGGADRNTGLISLRSAS
jgi:hypothetical protein